MNILTVRPAPIGWSLSVTGVANDTLFQSGAEAESAGRRLAMRLSAQGEPAKLVIQLRDGSVGGQFLFPPALSRSEDDDLRPAA